MKMASTCQGCKACLLFRAPEDQWRGMWGKPFGKRKYKSLEGSLQKQLCYNRCLDRLYQKECFWLAQEDDQELYKENITVQCSCSRRGVVVTNGVFSIDKGEDGESDCAERKRSFFNAPLKVVISCWYRTSSWTSNWEMYQWFFCPIITEATLNKIVVDVASNVHRREGKRERLKIRDRREAHTVAGEFLPTIEWVKDE